MPAASKLLLRQINFKGVARLSNHLVDWPRRLASEAAEAGQLVILLRVVCPWRKADRRFMAVTGRLPD